MPGITIDLSSYDEPARVHAAAAFAATSATFTRHGSVELDDALVAVPALVAAMAVGRGSSLDFEEVVLSLPFDADARARTAARAAAMACRASDDDLLRAMVSCAERGVLVDLPASSPDWAKDIVNDPAATIAAGLAVDAMRTANDPDHEPLTSAARAVSLLFPVFAGEPEAAPAPRM